MPYARPSLGLLALLAVLGFSPVHAQDPAVRPFSLRSGEFTVAYEPEAGVITVRHLDDPAVLVTRLAAGELFEVTAPGRVRAVRVTREPGVHGATIQAERDWADFTGTVEVYPDQPGLVRLRLDATTTRATHVAESPPELRFAPATPRSGLPGAPEVYAQMEGIEAPVAYLHHPAFGASVVYFQNLTALNPYLDQVQGDVRYTVRVDEAGIGFRRPQGMVPAGFSFTVSDVYLWLSPERPADDLARADQFVRAIADIYRRIPKPGTEYTDWPFHVAPGTSRALLEPLNGVEVAGTRLLKAYVGDIERQVEAIVNFDVLVPALKFAEMFGADSSTARLIDDIERGMRYWYIPLEDGMMTVADVPEPPPAIDAWYYVYPIVQTADLALLGNADAREMLLGSLPKLLELGRAFDYEFPFRLDPVTATRADDRFREYDVLGGYAYVMLAAHQLTGDETYLDEAKRAVEHIRGKGFGFTYELQMTGVTLDALAWLYELTGDERYVELSIVPISNLVALTWLWEPDYGFASEYQMFMGTLPLPASDQVAAFEMHNTWWSMQRFYQRTEAALPPHVRTLLAEMIRYQLTLGRYTFPRHLPPEAVSSEPDWGVIRPDLLIPVEDLKEGFHMSGMVGQEIYGSGIAYRFAGEAYRVHGDDGDVVLFAEYPIMESSWSEADRTLDFRIGGTPGYSSNVRVQLTGERAGGLAGATVRRVPGAGGGDVEIDVTRGEDYIEFAAPGGGAYRVTLAGADAGRAPEARAGERPDTPVGDRADPRAGAPSRGAGDAPAADGPSVRVAALLGMAGVVQMEAGRPLSIPLVVSNPGATAADVAFEADLPAGWRLEQASVRAPAGAETEHTLRVLAAAGVRTDTLYPVIIRARADGGTTPLLHTLVRPLAATDTDLGDPTTGLRAHSSNAALAARDSVAELSVTRSGAASFRSRVLTVDVDRLPYLDFLVDDIDGTWAVKVYEADSSPWGTYVLPEIPVIPEARETGWFRVSLPERTGWSGVHSFTIEIFVVGDEGSTLRLRDWRLAGPEVEVAD